MSLSTEDCVCSIWPFQQPEMENYPCACIGYIPEKTLKDHVEQFIGTIRGIPDTGLFRTVFLLYDYVFNTYQLLGVVLLQIADVIFKIISYDKHLLLLLIIGIP